MVTGTDISEAIGGPWKGRAIGLLDLDAFFASVEQLDHPYWRGKPVIVGGSADKRGVVSTASYEARAFGVRSAMPSAQAKRLCPHAIWTRGNFERYAQVSKAVMEVILDETPFVEQVSIDEAFFDITPTSWANENPIAICRRMQTRVAELGVTCSIGLSTSKTVAKIASEREKPRGLTVVLPGCERDFMANLPVDAMSGIGKRTKEHLAHLKIFTLGDLAQASPEKLRKELGVWGPRAIERAQGIEDSPVRRHDIEREVKSVSNERTFERDLTTHAELKAAILSISEHVGSRLRKKGLMGTTVTLRIKDSNLVVHSAQTQLRKPTQDEHEFGPVALELLAGLWSQGKPVRLVGVGISGFGEHAGVQQSLFDLNGSEAPKRDLAALSRAADAVRERFGNDALTYGRDLRLRGITSDTIPLNKN